MRNRNNRTISVDGHLLEKEEERIGDKLMETLGFEIVRFSQPRATMQSPGIPDRRYYSPARKVAFWMEYKTSKGVQSYAQKDFESRCKSVGEVYVMGTHDALIDYCREEGWIR